jgi:phosphohistidine phosphatase
MGQELAARGWVPNLIASSDSQRTRETWAAMRSELGADSAEVLWSYDLYLAGLGDIQEHSATWGDDMQTVLALGHNPGWSDAASILSGRPVGMTTANCALLVGSGATWLEALSTSWELVALLRPRELD